MWCKLKKKIQYLMSMVINIGVVFRYGKKSLASVGLILEDQVKRSTI